MALTCDGDQLSGFWKWSEPLGLVKGTIYRDDMGDAYRIKIHFPRLSGGVWFPDDELYLRK